MSKHLSEISMAKVRNNLFYGGLEREQYLEVLPELQEGKKRRVSTYSKVVLITVFLGFILTFCVNEPIQEFDANRFFLMIYSIMLFCLVLMNRIMTGISNRFINPMVFLSKAVFYALGIIHGTFSACSGENAVILLASIIIIPFIYYEPAPYSVPPSILALAAYYFIAIHTPKDPVLIYSDVVNGMGLACLGIFLSIYSTNAVVRELYLKRNLDKEVDKAVAAWKEQEIRFDTLSQETVSAMVEAIDAKSSYTHGHSRRVAKYTCMIADKAGIPEEKFEEIYCIGLLHDIGKIGIPDGILNKKGKLTDAEYEQIKSHTVIGGNILSQITVLPEIRTGAMYHHERYDGKGYPEGPSGKEIPEIARIISVADAYDAMTSGRSYRNIQPQDYVEAEIRNGRGTQFDPIYADIMLEIIHEDGDFKLHE